MMVSKVAVMALVAVIAVPILLGYALNLSEQTVTEYKPDGDSVNVSELLQTGTAYTSANADVYRLNTNMEHNGADYYPVYNSITTTKSSLQLYQRTYTVAAGSVIYWRINADGTVQDSYMYFGSNSDVTFEYRDQNGTTVLFTHADIEYVHYYASENVVEYGWNYGGGGGSSSFTPGNLNNFLYFSNAGGSAATVYYSLRATTTTTYVDLAGGFYTSSDGAIVKITDKSKSALVTVNLDSITASSFTGRYTIGQVSYLLQKTTTGSTVSWTATQQQKNQNGVYVDVNTTDLYYNPSGSNCYQIFVSATSQGSFLKYPGTPYEETWYRVLWHSELRYVGAWPTLIGAANYYLKYEYDLQRESSNSNANSFSSINVGVTSGTRSPTTRIDTAEFSAFAYSIITDTTYAPADFKTNPTTTLDVSKAGLSLEFGGNTYTVDSSGNITLGTHKVSVNGLKLESVPTAGGYENRINGTTISVTADPSTIRFNGNWGASVSTVANAASSYTHTEWTAGEFGWDGIDHNFLMVGLLTSLGAFIALGIYMRRTKAALWPLLIVCGGAAMLFFCML